MDALKLETNYFSDAFAAPPPGFRVGGFFLAGGAATGSTGFSAAATLARHAALEAASVTGIMPLRKDLPERDGTPPSLMVIQHAVERQPPTSRCG